MNNKGFTLIETLCVVVIISLISIITIRSFGETLSINKEEAYTIMKKSIIKASYNYLNECDSKTIECDFSLENKINFKAEILKEKGYFKNLNSPIDNKDLSNCLILEATKKNGVVVVDLKDNCY